VARQRRSGGYVLRTTSSVVTFWIGIAILAFVVGTPIVRGDWHLLAFAIWPALLLAWILWIVLYRPSVRWDAERATVVNIGRRHVIPWSQVRVVRQTINLVFELQEGDGPPVRAWGAPPPPRPGNIVSALDRTSRIGYDFHQNATLLESYRQSAPPDASPVEHRWEVGPLAIGAVLIVAVVIEVIVGI
jgi:hypothetical protein